MKYLLLLCLKALSIVCSHGQKIQGVYFGEIISEKNALIIESNGDVTKGFVYLNKTEKLEFSGSFKKPDLKGKIRLANGKDISLIAKLERNSLNVMFSGSNDVRVLHKISSNTNTDMNDLYSEQYDARLLGTWETFKMINKNGDDLTDGKGAHEYDFNGRGSTWLITIPAKANVVVRPEVNFHKKIEMNWSTNDGELTISQPTLGSRGIANSYYFRHDTLVTSGAKYITFWKRR